MLAYDAKGDPEKKCLCQRQKKMIFHCDQRLDNARLLARGPCTKLEADHSFDDGTIIGPTGFPAFRFVSVKTTRYRGRDVEKSLVWQSNNLITVHSFCMYLYCIYRL